MAYKICAFADEASNELSGQIETLNERGIRYIELRNLDGKNVAELTLDEAREIKKRFDESGISVWSIGSRLGKIGVFDDFSTHYDELLHTIDIAKTFGCDKIRMFSFYIPKDKSYSECKDEVMARLSRMVDAARGSGVTLCHENEKGIYGDNEERCLEIAKAFPEIKLVFDPANFVQCGVDTLKAWEMLSPYVEYLHIKDSLADGRIVPAGHGIGNVLNIVKSYMALGKEIMTLEPHLTLFEGLASLENRDIEKKDFPYEYPSAKAAFEAAHDALLTLIK